ncbi:MAG: uncharacterized protein PWQ30_452, partial [Euryarchaeota archaeon]|nr:uncharacterized protein [Euryarchaeota archaeon]
ALDAQYLEVDAGTHVACIPYHRVRRILYDGEVMWAIEPEMPRDAGET